MKKKLVILFCFLSILLGLESFAKPSKQKKAFVAKTKATLLIKKNENFKCTAQIQYTIDDSQGFSRVYDMFYTADTCEEAGKVLDAVVAVMNYFCANCIVVL